MAVASAHASNGGALDSVPEQAWPLFFLIGQPKAGTSSLFAELRHLKAVSGATPLEEEPVYFDKEVHFFDIDQRYSRGPGFYLQHFVATASNRAAARATASIFMDATPNYSNNETIPARMKATFPVAMHPRMRFILLLREPVARLLSWYNHQRVYSFEKNTNGFYCEGVSNWTISFREYCEASVLATPERCLDGHQSNLASVVEKYLSLFDPGQLLTLVGDELWTGQNAPAAKRAILDFLGVRLPPTSTWITRTPSSAFWNDHKSPHKVRLGPRDCSLVRRLEAHYRVGQAQLFKLVTGPKRPAMQPALRPFTPMSELMNCTHANLRAVVRTAPAPV